MLVFFSKIGFYPIFSFSMLSLIFWAQNWLRNAKQSPDDFNPRFHLISFTRTRLMFGKHSERAKQLLDKSKHD